MDLLQQRICGTDEAIPAFLVVLSYWIMGWFVLSEWRNDPGPLNRSLAIGEMGY